MQRPGSDDGMGGGMPSIGGSIPKSLSYGIESTSGLPGRRSLLQFSAENTSTFSPSNNVVRIPVNSTQFLDLVQGRLCFDLTISGTGTAVYLDGGAACVINRMRILSVTGLELERIESYNMLHTLLDQFTDTWDSRLSNSTTSGCPGKDRILAYSTSTAAAPTAAGLTVTAPGLLTYTGGAASMTLTGLSGAGSIVNVNTNSGAGTVTIPGALAGAAAGAVTTIVDSVTSIGYAQEDADMFAPNSSTIMRHYELRLRNGWFNPTLGKLLPPNVHFVIELTLATAASCLKDATSTASYTIQNFFYKVPGVMVSDSGFMERVRMLQQRGSEWNAVTYKLYTGVIAGVGQASVQISDRSHSLTALITILRSQAYVNDATRFSLSKRTIQYVSQYQATIGSDLYPPAQIALQTDATTGGGTPDGGMAVVATGTRRGDRWWNASTVGLNISQCYSEAKRVFGWNKGLVGINSFGSNEKPNNTGTGVLCIDCKSYHGEKRTTSGIDTASQAVPITLTMTVTAAASTGTANWSGDLISGTGANPNNGQVILPIQVDTYAQADIKFIMMPGGELRSMC